MTLQEKVKDIVDDSGMEAFLAATIEHVGDCKQREMRAGKSIVYLTSLQHDMMRTLSKYKTRNNRN